MFFFFLYKLLKTPFSYLKYKVFRKQREIKIPKIDNLLKTEKFHLSFELIENSHHHFKIAKKFHKTIFDNDDVDIYIIKNYNFSTVIDDFIITSFKYKLEDSLLFQRIRLNEAQKPTSDLVSFDFNSEEITVLGEIGLFELSEYDEAEYKITGYNLNTNEDITVKLQFDS